MRPLSSSLTALLSLFLLALPAAPGLAQPPHGEAGYDLVIANGKVVDGSGNPWFYGDLAIKNGHIAKVGKIDPKVGKHVIDAKGMVVTPGFIDLHTHSDMTVLADGNAESKVRQGVTLDVSARVRRWPR
jgi:N-acyl-D-amino-acid deacylase